LHHTTINEFYTLSLHDALPILQTLVDNGTITDALDFNALVENNIVSKNSLVKILGRGELKAKLKVTAHKFTATAKAAIEAAGGRSEEHTSELQSRENLVCRLLL